tara:strand:- start:97 stop:462 length:366 start_codon:yes stop_codon:yes gene_type:complete
MKLQNYFKIFFISFFAYSTYANESIDNKVKQLTMELRCMTCQNQSVYDSDSDYAKDVKLLVKQKFEEGLTEREIKDFLTKRYGEYILFKPYFNAKNLLLWLFPFVLVVGSLVVLIKNSKKT